MNRLERFLFPQSKLINFLMIACLSTAFSFLLIGRQVWQANWGIIDDHQIFDFLGPNLHLPLSEVWSTLLTKTEVGTLQGRFRPGYYLFTLLETSLWGDNVHLWYLARTLGFALFLGSIWWFMLRFVGGWLSGVLTAYIALLPMWAGVWSRLGPSEIYGSACMGIMVFASYFILFSEAPRIRNLNAIALALSTIALVGMKETFIPLAGGTAAILMLAGINKRLSPLLIGILVSAILACVGGIVFVLSKQVLSTGKDFYANSVGPWSTLGFAVVGFFDAILRTWWLFAIPIMFFQMLNVIPRRPLRNWIADSSVAFGAYGFLVVTYALQCALYRRGFPHNSRYDFPAMLLVPLTCCILACETSNRIRPVFPERTINYAQFAAAVFLLFALVLTQVGNPPPLALAVRKNIEATNSFFNELQRAVRAARESADRPIILEAYGSLTYEAVLSLSSYMSALGASNRMSVRCHPEEKSGGILYDSLQRTLSGLEENGSGTFAPLRDSLAQPHGCISIGIDGPPNPACIGFQMKIR